MRIFTYPLTSGELKLERQDGAIFLSIEVGANSSCTITGGIPFKGQMPIPIVLLESSIVNYRAASPASPLNNFTITWVSGTINLIIGF